MRRLTPAILLVAVALAGCGGNGSADHPSPAGTDTASASTSPAPRRSTAASSTGSPKVIGTIATGLSVPWGVAFLPDGSALVTERDTGRVLHLTGSGDQWKVDVVGHIAEHSVSGGESGLLGVAVSPSYDTDHRVFFYVSTSSDNRVVRTTYRDGHLGTIEPVLTGIPMGIHHDGGRLAFGPDGYLYVSTGESGVESLAQDKSSLGGKILRITQSGKRAPGDPWPDSPVWSWGHRNIQGLVFDPAGRLWASEFGDREYDELNLIREGGNYGWPYVQGRSNNPAYVNPAVQWPTEEASPSGLALAGGSFWLAALRGERLWRVPVHGRTTGTPKAYFIGRYGRMRTVVTTPDGNLWLTTSNRDGRGEPKAGDDRILLVRP